MFRIHGAPVIGVQQIAGIDLKAEHRPQEPTGILVIIRMTTVDIVGQLIQRRRFRGVAQAIALGLDVIGFGLDDAGGEGRVVEGAVIAFRVILDRNLPIAVLLHFHPFQRLQLRPMGQETLQLRPGVGEPRFHGGRVRIEVHEDEAEEDLRSDLRQANLGGIEARHGLGIGGRTQAPGQFVSPCVIRADNHAGRAFAADKLMRAVLTNVVEGADHAIAALDREQAFVRQLKCDVIARVLQLAGMAGKLPCAGQQPGLLHLEHLRVGVVARREGAQGAAVILHSGSSV